MKKYSLETLCVMLLVGLTTGVFATANAENVIDPEKDLQELTEYFAKKYPNNKPEDYAIGNYVFNEDLKDQFLATEDFPPYEDDLIAGEEIWNKPFKNGKTFADCYPGKEVSEIKPSYPYFDEEREEVVTLELSINECLAANGEKKFGWKKGKIAQLSAYLNRESNGTVIAVKVESEKAKQAYQEGKHFFFGKRGQLNLSCADCHIYYSGLNARSQVLSSVLGHTSHFPVYRKKWSSLGTLHRRYGGCQGNVRAKPYKAQSKEYRNLEFFHTYMSNGIKLNGPQTRG